MARALTEPSLAPGTVLRWIEDGFIPAEQPTPGAPWEIRLTDGQGRQKKSGFHHDEFLQVNIGRLAAPVQYR